MVNKGAKPRYGKTKREEVEKLNREMRVYKTWRENPYAIAKQLLRSKKFLKKNPEFSEGKPFLDKQMQKVRRKNLQKILGANYNTLFDLTTDHKLFQESDKGIQKSPPLPSGGCAATHWGTYNYNNNPAPFFNTNFALSAIVHDPIQGCQPNCYLFAALCSAAFSIPNWIPPLTNPPYTLTLYDRNQGGKQITLQKREICLDASDLPVNGRPTPDPNWNFGVKEIWCAIYEIAYAKLKNFPASPLPSDGNNGQPYPEHPDMNYFTTYNGQGYGDPLEALYNFTGWDYSSSTQVCLGNYNPTVQADRDTIFTTIDNICGWTYTHPVNKSISKRTQKPAVAWTYKGPSFPPPDPQVTYEDFVLVEGHCYSILGTYVSSTADGKKKYFIMRNPWGSVWGWGDTHNDPTFIGAIDPRLRSATVLENWAPQFYSPPVAGRPLGFQDGIFAINVEMFMRYFRGFGWVVSPA